MKLKFKLPLPSILAMTVLAAQLAACGQTGPLYLPPKPKAISVVPEQAPPRAASDKAFDNNPVPASR